MKKKTKPDLKIKVTPEDAKKLWHRLFGEEDKAQLKNLSKTEFKRLVIILENLEAKIEWEADKFSQIITIWKPKEDTSSWKDYTYFLLLLSIIGHPDSKWLAEPFPPTRR